VKIEHIALNVEDPAEVVQWYVEHLGMRIARKVDNAEQMHFIADSAGAGLIEFYYNQSKPVLDFRAIDAYSFHIALSSEDIEADISRLVAVGASQDGEINNTPAGDRLVFLRDPWGICLQLVARANPIL